MTLSRLAASVFLRPSRAFPSPTRNLSQEAMELNAWVSRFEAWSSPRWAEKWDNVGLLIEPSGPHTVRKVMLTNDLTEDVMGEAVESQADLILAYHPPIFAPLKRITQASWKERIVQKCLENRIALYSPHTAFDAMAGGVADWLLDPIGQGPITVLDQKSNPRFEGGISHSVLVQGMPPMESKMMETTARLIAIGGTKVHVQDSDSSLTIDCSEHSLTEVVSILRSSNCIQSSEVKVMKLEKHPVPGHGLGRLKTLEPALTLREIVGTVKKYTGVEHLRISLAVGKDLDCSISSVASCAGSGNSVLKGCSADLWLTGEMSHHELLDAAHNGSCVILCEHSNSERNFLRDVLVDKLQTMFQDIQVTVSKLDRDPVTIV